MYEISDVILVYIIYAHWRWKASKYMRLCLYSHYIVCSKSKYCYYIIENFTFAHAIQVETYISKWYVMNVMETIRMASVCITQQHYDLFEFLLCMCRFATKSIFCMMILMLSHFHKRFPNIKMRTTNLTAIMW